MNALATLAPGAERVALDQVERVLPAVRSLQVDPAVGQA
jgi:hypothetical protein